MVKYIIKRILIGALTLFILATITFFGVHYMPGAGRAMLRSVELRPPYEGAKDYFYIADVDDRDYISELVRVTCKHLPLPKRRKPASPAK